ncbi:MarR family transcriptional regulator [Streptomyces sp. NPDC048669]|uniref:MarR family winged helix-turn-helix transcriptional regulator n=1 Tax=Streptomyces sp. NPDC048669 TaxID=3155267 RepID=UPI00341E93D9
MGQNEAGPAPSDEVTMTSQEPQDPQESQEGAPATQDAVDRMIAEWAEVRPGLDVSSNQVVSRMLRLIRLFERDRERVLESVELEPWSFDMLALLRRRSLGAATPRDLMSATLVTSGTMTARLKSLESRGWVTRSPDTIDRRQVIVKLTTPGRELFDQVFADVLDCQNRLIACLDKGEREHLAGVFRMMLLNLED